MMITTQYSQYQSYFFKEPPVFKRSKTKGVFKEIRLTVNGISQIPPPLPKGAKQGGSGKTPRILTSKTRGNLAKGGGVWPEIPLIIDSIL